MVEVSHLLDTNVLVQILRGKADRILPYIRKYTPGSLAVSAVSMGELSFGAVMSQKDSERSRVRYLLTDFVIVPFDASIAWEYGTLRSELTAKGNVIGGLDMMIAATARCNGWTLVTHNTREFRRVPNLRFEDWER